MKKIRMIMKKQKKSNMKNMIKKETILKNEDLDNLLEMLRTVSLRIRRNIIFC